MKPLYLTYLMAILFPYFGFSSSLEEELKNMACEIAVSIENRQIENVAVWQFEGLDVSAEMLGKHLSEDFSSYLLNSSNTLKVYERDQIDRILEELKLQNSGLIEPSTAQKLGSFTGVQAIVTGQYSIINDKLKLWIKVIETESAFQIAALSRELSFDKKDFQPIAVKASSASPRTGKLRVKNNKKKSVTFKIEGPHTSKTFQVDRKSSTEILSLQPGVYTCTAGYTNSSQSFEKSEILIEKDKKTLKKIKGKRRWPGLLVAAMIYVPILMVSSK